MIHPILNVTLSLSGVPRWIGDWFKKADKNNDGRMNFKEVQDLLKMMNVDMNEHHAHRLFTVRAFESSSPARVRRKTSWVLMHHQT